MMMGISILILNRAFNADLGLILPILFLGAVMAVCFGLMLGAFISDMGPLYTAIKLAGFVLYVPGILYLFPQVPAWIGRIFPTFYVINPLMELTRRGGGWPTIQVDFAVLIVVVAVCVAAVGVIAKTTRQQEG
jgi:ABC-2 type transport system permease protein